ncbi:DsbA family protein [Pseudovibrio denitrificans]|uniref:DsbA family protein n=1 Tax=Pseudovibrio denitrificans TaxID=258256 RepID=UPI0039BED3CB
MNFLARTFSIFMMVLFASGTNALADVSKTLSEEHIKELALEAILENPTIIEEAIQRLQKVRQEQRQAGVKNIIELRRDTLENDPNAPILGNPSGDVTLVEFFDYNCPYCKRAKPELEALLENDTNVRLVFREWPILGAGSVFAARAALAARKQGKYEDFHWALMGFKGRIDETSTMKVARQIGLDIEQLKSDMEDPSITEHIQLSMTLAQDLNITGTPSFVVGDDVFPGLLTRDQLAEVVAENR